MSSPPYSMKENENMGDWVTFKYRLFKLDDDFYFGYEMTTDDFMIGYGIIQLSEKREGRGVKIDDEIEKYPKETSLFDIAKFEIGGKIDHLVLQVLRFQGLYDG